MSRFRRNTNGCKITKRAEEIRNNAYSTLAYKCLHVADEVLLKNERTIKVFSPIQFGCPNAQRAQCPKGPNAQKVPMPFCLATDVREYFNGFRMSAEPWLTMLYH